MNIAQSSLPAEIRVGKYGHGREVVNKVFRDRRNTLDKDPF